MNFNFVKSPCYKCKDRYIEPVNCHSVCEKYLEYRAKHDEENNKVFKEKVIDKTVSQMITDGATSKRKNPLPLQHGRSRKK